MIKLDRTVNVATLVKWIIGLGGVLVWLTLQWARIGTLEGRIQQLEGGMDVRNGIIRLGETDAYYRGANEALKAERPVEEEP